MIDETDRDDRNVTTPTERMLTWGKNSAFYRLHQRDLSETELFNALKRKALKKFPNITMSCAEKIAEQTVSHCKGLKLLDDNRYANNKANSAANAGKSKRMIALKLREKGIDPETVGEVLQETDDRLAALIHCRKRRIGPFSGIQDKDQKRILKELSSLARSGFSQNLARTVFQMSREEAEDEIFYISKLNN